MADTEKKAAEEVAKPEAEAKTAEPEKEKAEEAAPKEPEKPKELEEDAKPLKGKKLADDSVAFSAADATLNVMPSLGGKIMMSLADDGFQHLLACARANVGVKTGRYMFEVRILESRVSAPNQKPVVRVGFSFAGASLFLTDTEDSVSFDESGVLCCEKKRTRPGQCRFTKGMHVAVLLNREAGSANEETISIFIGGARACEPQKLPEAWKGKTLYPTINYKHVTLEANFGPAATCPLPFSCHMLAGAAKSDIEVSTLKEPAKAEVLIPVGLPNQGVVDWVEDFIQKNPTYVELSSRAMTQWALKSGATNPKMDDFSLMQSLKAVAPVLKKNYVYMELKSNLIAKEREMALKGFLGADFKKVAAVIMGEPTAEYKEKVKSFILEEKTKLAVIEMEKKKAEASRKRAAAERLKKAEAAKKARLAAAQKKKDGDDDKAEEKEEEAEEKPTEEEDIKMEPVELTEDEKKIWYRSSSLSEIPEHILAKVFVSFSLPEKTEGFDDIKFLWQPESNCAKHLTEYILSRKLTSRVDDLQPGEWFKTNSKEFQTWFASLKKRQNEWKNPAQKKALLAKIIAAKTEKKEAGEGDEKKEEAPPVELPEVNAEDLEPSEVTDVMDIGSGEPLFANFASEDWELLSLRAEFLFLVHGFKKDMNDPERTGFHESHTSFYYQKYFKKAFDFKQYGQSSLSGFISLIKDAITLNSQGILEAVLPEDAPKENLVKLAEEHRRDRQRRVDAGDETAELKFKKPQQPSFAPAAKRPYQGGGKGGIQPAWTANKQPRHLQPVRR